MASGATADLRWDLAVAHEADPDESSILVGALFVVGRHGGAARGASTRKICAPLLLGRASASHDLRGGDIPVGERVDAQSG